MARMAASHDGQPGFSPVIHGDNRPVKSGEEAPITETAAVETSVNEVTYMVEPKAKKPAERKSAGIGTRRKTSPVRGP